MKNIITIQHTQAEHHVKKMVGGDTDWPLTEIGKEQAHNIGKNIKTLINSNEKSIIYSSDLIRAKQTAEIVNEYLNFPIIFKQELREISMGEAKGKSKEWYGQNCVPKGNIPLIKYRPFPSAETYEEVYNRIFPIIDVVLKNDCENTIIVGHGFSLLMFFLQWLKIPIENMENTAFDISSGGVSFYSIWEGKRMLKKYNITSFMNGI
jgi:probable phosphoglycerate mutase